MKTIVPLCSILPLVIAGPALAAQTKMSPNTPVENVSPNTIDPAVGKMTAGQLIGHNVRDPNGHVLAKIENIVQKNGETYAVLDVDHKLDVSSNDAVIPLSRIHKGIKHLTLNMTKNELNSLERWQTGQYQEVKHASKLASIH